MNYNLGSLYYQLARIYHKCSQLIKKVYQFTKRTLTMSSSSEAVWFDGVDKKLIEMHSKAATSLVDCDNRTLMTKTPLASLSSLSRKAITKKKDHYELNGNKQEVELGGKKRKELPVPESNGVERNQPQTSQQNIKRRKIASTNNDTIKPNSGITDELAIDCEMVECFHHKSVLARVSIVNLFGHPIMDRYVAPPAPVTDYRTRYSGIRKRDLINAPDFDTVQNEVANLIKDRIVVGHAVHNDFQVLKIHHPTNLTRDTSHYYKYLFEGKTPSLKKLSESVLGVKIQKGEHDSVQDAQATMKLYVKERDRWNEKLIKEGHSKMMIQHSSGKQKHQKTKPKKKKLKTFYVTTT